MQTSSQSGAQGRSLGVIEAISAARDQCPNAAVREHAARALEAIRTGGPDALREQAFLVFSTLAGWRGARAEQVRRSLRDYLATTDPATRRGPERPDDA